MLTQSAGWAIEPDYLAAFRLENYRFALPPYDAPTIVSQFTSALAGGLFVALAAIEFIAALNRRRRLAAPARDLLLRGGDLLPLARGRGLGAARRACSATIFACMR